MKEKIKLSKKSECTGIAEVRTLKNTFESVCKKLSWNMGICASVLSALLIIIAIIFGSTSFIEEPTINNGRLGSKEYYELSELAELKENFSRKIRADNKYQYFAFGVLTKDMCRQLGLFENSKNLPIDEVYYIHLVFLLDDNSERIIITDESQQTILEIKNNMSSSFKKVKDDIYKQVGGKIDSLFFKRSIDANGDIIGAYLNTKSIDGKINIQLTACYHQNYYYYYLLK